MKWKIAVVLTTLVLGACSTVPPPGSTMAGWAKELYSGEEVKKRGPEYYARLVAIFGEAEVRGMNVVVQTRSYQSALFGDGAASYAFVPRKFRDRIKTGDITVIWVVDSGAHKGEYAILTDLNPPNCKSVSPYGIGSPEVYCNGEPAKLAEKK